MTPPLKPLEKATIFVRYCFAALIRVALPGKLPEGILDIVSMVAGGFAIIHLLQNGFSIEMAEVLRIALAYYDEALNALFAPFDGLARALEELWGVNLAIPPSLKHATVLAILYARNRAVVFLAQYDQVTYASQLKSRMRYIAGAVVIFLAAIAIGVSIDFGLHGSPYVLRQFLLFIVVLAAIRAFDFATSWFRTLEAAEVERTRLGPTSVSSDYGSGFRAVLLQRSLLWLTLSGGIGTIMLLVLIARDIRDAYLIAGLVTVAVSAFAAILIDASYTARTAHNFPDQYRWRVETRLNGDTRGAISILKPFFWAAVAITASAVFS